MTNKNNGVSAAGISKEVEALWQDSRVRAVLQALFFVLAGLLSAFLKKLSPGLGVSGSSAVYWLAPMITARICMKRDGGGTLTGLFTALWGIPFGLNNDLMHNIALYAGAGLAIDVMAWLPFMNIRKVWGATLTGIVAHMVKFAIIVGSAVTSPVTRNFMVAGVLQSAYQHVIFGAGAGFVAWTAYKVWQSGGRALENKPPKENKAA